MKKIICLLGITLLLTACSSGVEVGDMELLEAAIAKEENRQNVFLIDDDIKKTVEEINSLGEKYQDESLEYGRNYPYINLYGDSYGRLAQDIEFNNWGVPSQEYFDQLIEILDKDLVVGLKDYLENTKEKLEINQSTRVKIDRAVIYTENREGDEENHISILVKLSDIVDEDYRELVNKISDDKYILENIIIGEKRNMIDLENINLVHSRYGYKLSDGLRIRYNLFLQDKRIKKVNILLQGKDGEELKEEDMDVFINLLNVLELNGEDKGILINKYRDILKNKEKNQQISIGDYQVLIKRNKANIYRESDRELIYFSIEEKLPQN